jgi:hypothetical protein
VSRRLVSSTARSRSKAQTAQGKLYLFVAIDRTSNFAVARLVDKANTQTARAFLEALCPYRVEIGLPRQRHSINCRLSPRQVSEKWCFPKKTPETAACGEWLVGEVVKP